MVFSLLRILNTHHSNTSDEMIRKYYHSKSEYQMSLDHSKVFPESDEFIQKLKKLLRRTKTRNLTNNENLVRSFYEEVSKSPYFLLILN